MKKVAIYARVSTAEQKTQRQINDLKVVISNDGYEDNQIDIYAENISGYKKNSERPELTKLLNKVTEYDCVYTTEVSRIGRNPTQTRKIFDDLSDLNIPIYIHTIKLRTIENGKRNGLVNVILQVLIEYADSEAETFKERSKSGFLNSAKAGKWTSGKITPFGYTKDKAGFLIIDEEEALAVNQIFDLYKQGFGLKRIAGILNDNGVKTKYNKMFAGVKVKFEIQKDGDKIIWTDVSVHNVLTNTIYKGERNHKGHILNSPVIIQQELFDEINLLLKDKTHTNYLTTYDYLVKDKLTCGCCNRGYFAKYKPNTKGGDKVYICSSRLIKGGNCGNLGVNIDLLESAIYDAIIRQDITQKYIVHSSEIKEQLSKDIKNLQVDLSLSKNNKVSIEKKLKKVLDAYVNDVLTEDEFELQNSSLKAELANIIKKLNKIENLLKNKQTAFAEFDKEDYNKTKLLEAKTNRQELKAIFNQLISRIVISNYDESSVILAVFIKIKEVELSSPLLVKIDVSGMRKKTKVFRYKTHYEDFFKETIEEFEYSDFDFLDWNIIENEHLIIL